MNTTKIEKKTGLVRVGPYVKGSSVLQFHLFHSKTFQQWNEWKPFNKSFQLSNLFNFVHTRGIVSLLVKQISNGRESNIVHDIIRVYLLAESMANKKKVNIDIASFNKTIINIIF